jgi:hypothetical protein
MQVTTVALCPVPNVMLAPVTFVPVTVTTMPPAGESVVVLIAVVVGAGAGT